MSLKKSDLKNIDQFWIKKIKSEKYRLVFVLEEIRSKNTDCFFEF